LLARGLEEEEEEEEEELWCMVKEFW